MKVVLFCGGLGMRMRLGEGELVPKPLAMVGERPLLWHVMRWYAHWGHTEFILCLGHGGQQIKDYFLEYRETSSNDFSLDCGTGDVRLHGSDISEWRITFVDTGLTSSIGERLRRVRPLLGDAPVFLANYGDVLSDARLPDMVERLHASGAAAALLAVRPTESFHVVRTGDDSLVQGMSPAADLDLWINGGYFVLTQAVFDALEEGGDLVDGAFGKLASARRLLAYRHEGFWQPADTWKERHYLESLHRADVSPWAVWESRSPRGDRRRSERRRSARER